MTDQLKDSTVMPKAPNPVNERPSTQTMKEYREERRSYKQAIKDRLQQGCLVFLSQEILFDELGKPVAMRYKKGKTFVGSTRTLQLV